MLTKLALQNFKAWERCAIELGHINVLIGPNGSGKSSLLQALGLLKQSRNQEELVWNGPYESLGRFEDVVSGGSGRKTIQIQLSIKSEGIQTLADLSSPFECDYSCSLDVYGPVIHRTEYRLDNLGSLVATYDFRRQNGSVEAWPNDLFNPIRMKPGGLIAVPLYVQAPPGETGAYQAGRYVRDVVLNKLSNTHFVKTKRPVEEASYLGRPGGIDFTEAGDVANFIAYDDDARQTLSDWLSKILDEDIDLSTRFLPDYRVALELRRDRDSTNVAHEGAGIQNIVWPLAQIAAVPAGSLIALEEPEVHLHPKAQAKVGQVLTEIARTEEKQILVTSQSEHILMSFLTEAVKSGASSDDFRVYYCTSNNRVAEIEELRLDTNGGLDGGLKGFFEANFDETQRFLEALAARNTK